MLNLVIIIVSDYGPKQTEIWLSGVCVLMGLETASICSESCKHKMNCLKYLKYEYFLHKAADLNIHGHE